MTLELTEKLWALREKLEHAFSGAGIHCVTYTQAPYPGPNPAQDLALDLIMAIVAADAVTLIEMNAREHHRNWPACQTCVNMINDDMEAAHFFGTIAHDILGIPENLGATNELVITALRDITEIIKGMRETVAAHKKNLGEEATADYNEHLKEHGADGAK